LGLPSRYDDAGLSAMGFKVRPVEVKEILPWRELYRQEMNCQIIHDSLHVREGWTEPYRIELDGEVAGYGSIVVGGPWAGTRTIFELYVVEQQRSRIFEAFDALRSASGANAIETQTNDFLLAAMLHTWAHDVVSEKIVFEDRITTAYRVRGAVLRKREPEGDGCCWRWAARSLRQAASSTTTTGPMAISGWKLRKRSGGADSEPISCRS
jgi:hypothetical protein